MKELFAVGKTLPEAYHKAITLLNNEGVRVACTDWNTNCLECGMTMVVEEPLAEPRISRVAFSTPDSLKAYLSEMLDGSMDWAIAEGKEPYTYHDRMVNYDGINQLRFVVEELRRNPESRRAAVLIRSKDDIGNSDPACLQHMSFYIREGKLDCMVLFRSNDGMKATFMNAYALIEIQKRLADEIGVPVGTYTHRANSFHCYEPDWNTLDSACRRIESGNNLFYDSESYFEMCEDEE